MTPQQVDLIRSSFAKIFAAKEQSAKIFYERLFEVTPELRKMFKADLQAQGRKFMDMLGLIVATLRDPENMSNLLHTTAKRHVGYGVTAEHYHILKQALFWMLRKQLGAQWTPAVEAAWAELYRLVAETMQQAGNKAKAPSRSEQAA